jgi:hypothetical protein
MYNIPALKSIVFLRLGVKSGCPKAIAVRQIPTATYRNVNTVKRLIALSYFRIDL